MADCVPKKKKSFKEGAKLLLSNGMWVYKILFSLSKLDTFVYVTSSLLSAAVPTLTSFLGARFIDQIIQLASSDVQKLSDISITSPIFITLGLTVLSSLSNRLIRRTNEYFRNRFRRYHLRKYQISLYERISEIDVRQFEDPSISNDIQKAKDNFYKIEVYSSGSIQVVTDLISTTISGVISFSISPLLSLLVVILSIPNNIVYARFIRKLWNYYNNSIEESRKSWWLLGNITREENIPEHKISESNRHVSNLTKEFTDDLYKREIDVYKSRFTGSIFSSILNSVIYILAPIYLISLVLKGQLTIGKFTFYQGKFLDFSGDLDYVLGELLDLYDSATYVSYVRNILELKPHIKSGSKRLSSKKPPKIEFRNVSFKYPKSKKYALRNISLTIESGAEIAIVGENGAGKTTMIKLLLRFYDPTEGGILINGTPLPQVDLANYYNIIGALFQEYNCYHALTVRENITIGDTKTESSQERIKDAAIKADAAKFIKELDNGYDQKLAKEFTGGTNLSTGQWQKLALARMFYRNRPILILDEPTASIDAAAEYKIFKKVYLFIRNKTVIIISHRFSTVRNASKIYVLKDGAIIESGTHEELLKKGGSYAKAFKLQAEGYNK